MNLCVIVLWTVCALWVDPIFVVLPAGGCTAATAAALAATLRTLDGDLWLADEVSAVSGAHCAPPRADVSAN